MVSVLVLILALLLRILASDHLRNMQDLLLGEGEAVAAFCEEFVKHDLTP